MGRGYFLERMFLQGRYRWVGDLISRHGTDALDAGRMIEAIDARANRGGG